jgi:hypothetical protein
MAMVYTLVTSAQEWLSERFGQDTSIEDAEAEVAATEDVWVYSNFFSLSPLFYLFIICFLYIMCICSFCFRTFLSKIHVQDLKSS